MTDESITTRPVSESDRDMIGRLHASVFGPGRFARSAYRVREGTAFASPYCRAALKDGQIFATLRLTPVTIGGTRGALMLGPLAVAPDFANQGHGRRLVAESFAAAKADGYHLIVLVGDLSYYSRMQFVAVPERQIWLPGPADPARILGHELVSGAIAEFHGLVLADRSAEPLPPQH